METQRKRKDTLVISSDQQMILKNLYKYQYLTAPMIQKLMNIKSIRTTQYRLHSLWESGFVKRIRLSHIVGTGSNPLIYGLSPSGFRILGDDILIDFMGKDIRKKDFVSRGAMQLSHLLAVNRFLVLLESTANKEDIFLSECIQYYQKSRLEKFTINFVPDALFILSRQEKQSLFFLEVDRGTEPLFSNNLERSSIHKKFNDYFNMLKIGSYTSFGTFSGFRVLFVTSNKARRDSLLKFACTQPHSVCLWFAVESDLQGSNIFYDRFWNVPNENQLRSLVQRT